MPFDESNNWLLPTWLDEDDKMGESPQCPSMQARGASCEFWVLGRGVRGPSQAPEWRFDRRQLRDTEGETRETLKSPRRPCRVSGIYRWDAAALLWRCRCRWNNLRMLWCVWVVFVLPPNVISPRGEARSRGPAACLVKAKVAVSPPRPGRRSRC